MFAIRWPYVPGKYTQLSLWYNTFLSSEDALGKSTRMKDWVSRHPRNREGRDKEYITPSSPHQWNSHWNHPSPQLISADSMEINFCCLTCFHLGGCLQISPVFHSSGFLLSLSISASPTLSSSLHYSNSVQNQKSREKMKHQKPEQTEKPAQWPHPTNGWDFGNPIKANWRPAFASISFFIMKEGS